jgi:hypothetical protein
MIIIGFYFGNDIIGAYRTVYTKEYWKYLRNPDFAINHNTDLNLNDLSPKPYKYFRGIRAWLSKHSILYRASVFSFGNAYRFFEMKYGPSTDNITIFEDKTLKVRTGFTPKRRLIALNFQDPKVREGLRLSLELLSKMRDICKNESIDFFVVLIPTKEHVYSEYIENNTKLKNSDIINALLKNERDANMILKDYLKKNNIEYFDVLEPLKKSLVKKTIYPLSSDGHPNGEGHAIIANAVKQYIVERKLLGN